MDNLNRQLASSCASLTADELELAHLIVITLELDVQPQAIDPTATLFGDGLGLDSIDVLEIALVISRQYGVKLRSDDERSPKIFSSLRSLNEHIQAHRIR
jgi:acyl carrier protein